MSEFQNTKTFLLKDIIQIGLKKLKILFYVIDDLNGERIIATFYEKQLQKRISKDLRQKKSLKKEINYMSNGKVMIIHLIAGMIKKN